MSEPLLGGEKKWPLCRLLRLVESIARVRELGMLPVVELAYVNQAEALFDALCAAASQR